MMEILRNAGICVPKIYRLIKNKNDRYHPCIYVTVNNINIYAIEYIEGIHCEMSEICNDKCQLQMLGEMAAKINIILKNYDHKEAHYDFDWDLFNFEKYFCGFKNF